MATRRSSRLSTSSATSEQDHVKLESPQQTSMLPPATPSPRKRRKLDSTAPPPITPTPSAIGLMTSNVPFLPRPAESESAGNSPIKSSPEDESPTKKPRVRKPREARTNMTNAPLQTPRGSKVIAASAEAHDGSFIDEDGEPQTTENLLQKAEAFLIKQDPRLRDLVEAHKCHMFTPEGLAEVIEPFQSLTSGIMGQQVSGAAAKSIRNKFISLFHQNEDGTPGTYPTPDEVVKTDLAHLRTAGLSARKAEYIQGLAEKFVSGELTAKMLIDASDEEVLQKLVAVRGLGRWSVEMFACFGLKRTDIFSTGDLGVQRGCAIYLGKDVAKLKNKGGKWKYCSEQDMLDVASKFVPYRSIFMWYMWRIDGVNIDVFQQQSSVKREEEEQSLEQSLGIQPQVVVKEEDTSHDIPT